MSEQQNQQVVARERKSVLVDMATRFGMEPNAFHATLMATVMPSNIAVTNEQFAAFLLVAKQYNLNPITKEIYAYPDRKGGIQPIVSIDGWMRMVNNHPQFDGMDFNDNLDGNGNLVSITCRMFRKDRAHPVEVTEYMSECKQSTPTWAKWPARMLRHKATIQAARYAFGFSGIYDEDEVARMSVEPARQSIDVTPPPSATPGRPSRLAAIVQNNGVTVPSERQEEPAPQEAAE